MTMIVIAGVAYGQPPEPEVRLIFQRVPNELQFHEGDWQVYVPGVVFGTELRYGARCTIQAFFNSTALAGLSTFRSR